MKHFVTGICFTIALLFAMMCVFDLTARWLLEFCIMFGAGAVCYSVNQSPVSQSQRDELNYWRQKHDVTPEQADQQSYLRD